MQNRKLSMTSKIIRVVVLLVLLHLAGISLTATPITYTEQALLSGTLGAIAFSNAEVILTFSGDTDNIVFSQSAFRNRMITTGTVQIAGLREATFTDGLSVAASETSSLLMSYNGYNGPDVSLNDHTLGGPILAVFSTALDSYNLGSPIGPITGLGVVANGSRAYPTTAGDFVINPIPTGPNSASFVVDNVTFTAQTSEPSTISFFAISLIGLLLYRRKQLQID